MPEGEKLSDAARAEVIESIKKRPAQSVGCERILVPTDGSEEAFAALKMALKLARATDAELTILMVVDLNRHVAAFEQVSLSGYVPAELKVAAYQYLASVMHAIPSSIHAHPRVETGEPGEVILDVADEEESDLIVIGRRGFGTFRRFLLGSVSSYVVQRSPIPVLLVKGEESGEE